ncbi:MAG: GTPase domain-containing protein [SAR324 cluster bacterium]|nr:GTPase domain-containing protein [SAR324 cluster bacterium]
MQINFSLISHTNVGKTTLARTLLRQEVGDVLDREHVTHQCESYTMFEIQEDRLVLWDTPGFGFIQSQFVEELHTTESPIENFLTKTATAKTESTLWSSQLAVKNIRETADIVLYLVDAKSDPEWLPYLPVEMKILGWINKPTVILLNQTGTPRASEDDTVEREKWYEPLKNYSFIKTILSLDAFTRCWVQEGELFNTIGPLLPLEQQTTYDRLKSAWKEENFQVFRSSIKELARHLTESIYDSTTVSDESLFEKVGLVPGERQKELKHAHREMSERLAQRVIETTNNLIHLHQLEGQSAKKTQSLTQNNLRVPEHVNESIWIAFGGAATGAATGLIADILAGGLSFFGGALLGAIGGGTGTYLLAKSYNLIQGNNNAVRWTRNHFLEQVQLAMLSYLAVAHYGRGRGEWKDSESSQHWKNTIQQILSQYQGQFEQLWEHGDDEYASKQQTATKLNDLLKLCTTLTLQKLYPEVVIF